MRGRAQTWEAHVACGEQRLQSIIDDLRSQVLQLQDSKDVLYFELSKSNKSCELLRLRNEQLMQRADRLSEEAKCSAAVFDQLETLICDLLPRGLKKSCLVCGTSAAGQGAHFSMLSRWHVDLAKEKGFVVSSAWVCPAHHAIPQSTESVAAVWQKFSDFLKGGRVARVDHQAISKACTICGDCMAETRPLPSWLVSTAQIMGYPILSNRVCATCSSSRLAGKRPDVWSCWESHARALRVVCNANEIRSAHYATPSRIRKSEAHTPHASTILPPVDRSIYVKMVKNMNTFATMTSAEIMSVDLDRIGEINLLEFIHGVVQTCHPLLDEICGFKEEGRRGMDEDQITKSRCAAVVFWMALEGIKCRQAFQGFRTLLGLGLDSVRTSQHVLMSILHQFLGLTCSAQQTRKMVAQHAQFTGLTDRQIDAIKGGTMIPIQSWDNLESYERKAGANNVFSSGVSHIVVSSHDLTSSIAPLCISSVDVVLPSDLRGQYPSLDSPEVWRTDFMSNPGMLTLFLPNILPYDGSPTPRVLHSGLQLTAAPGVLAWKTATLSALLRLASNPAVVSNLQKVEGSKRKKHVQSIFPNVYKKTTNFCVKYLKDTKANKKDHIEDVLVGAVSLLAENDVLDCLIAFTDGNRSTSERHPPGIVLEMDVGMEIPLMNKLAEVGKGQALDDGSTSSDSSEDDEDTDSHDDGLAQDRGALAIAEDTADDADERDAFEPPADGDMDAVAAESERRKYVHDQLFTPIAKYLRHVRVLPAHLHIHMKALNNVVLEVFPIFNFVLTDLTRSSVKILRAEQQYYDNLEVVRYVHCGLMQIFLDTVVRYDRRFVKWFGREAGGLVVEDAHDVDQLLADVYYEYYYQAIASSDITMQLLLGFIFETGPMVMELTRAYHNGNTPFMEATLARVLAHLATQNHRHYRKSLVRHLVLMSFRSREEAVFDLANATVSVRGREGKNVPLDMNQEWWHRFMSEFIEAAHNSTEYIEQAATTARVKPFLSRFMKDTFMKDQYDDGTYRGKAGSKGIEEKMNKSLAILKLFQPLREGLAAKGLWLKNDYFFANDGKDSTKSEGQLDADRLYRSKATGKGKSAKRKSPRKKRKRNAAAHVGLVEQLRWWAKRMKLQGRPELDANLESIVLEREADRQEFEREHARMVLLQGKQERHTRPLQRYYGMGEDAFRAVTDGIVRRVIADHGQALFDQQVETRFGMRNAARNSIFRRARLEWRRSIHEWSDPLAVYREDAMERPLWRYRPKGAPSSVVSRRPLFSNLVDRCMAECRVRATDDTQHAAMTKAIAVVEVDGMIAEFWTEVGYYRRETWTEEVQSHKRFRHDLLSQHGSRGDRGAKRTASTMECETATLTLSAVHATATGNEGQEKAQILQYLKVRTDVTPQEVQDFVLAQEALEDEQRFLAMASRDGAADDVGDEGDTDPTVRILQLHD
jgi:hypothetical protein